MNFSEHSYIINKSENTRLKRFRFTCVYEDGSTYTFDDPGYNLTKAQFEHHLVKPVLENHGNIVFMMVYDNEKKMKRVCMNFPLESLKEKLEEYYRSLTR